MPKRHQSETSYRYAYNGMEQDPEVKGDGNSYTTEFRQYDPRVGRWLSLDPMMQQRVSHTPYNFGRNNPIVMVDPSGALDDWYESECGEIVYFEGETRESIIESVAVFSNGELEHRYEIEWKKIDYVSDADNNLSNNLFSNIADVQYSFNSTSFMLRQPNNDFSLKSPGPGAYIEIAVQFTGPASQNLKRGTNGRYYNMWFGNQYVKTSNVFDKNSLKILSDRLPFIGTTLDILEIGDGMKRDGWKIGKNFFVELSGVFGGTMGTSGGAYSGAFIGTLIGGPLGTVIGGTIGAGVGSWLGELGAEKVTEKVIEKVNERANN